MGNTPPLPPRPTLPAHRVLVVLAYSEDLDPKTLRKEFEHPGSVKGRAGVRARRAIDRWRSVRRSSRQTSPIATRIRQVKNAVRCAVNQARGCGRTAVAIPSQTAMKRKMNPWRSNRRRCASIKLVMDP